MTWFQRLARHTFSHVEGSTESLRANLRQFACLLMLMPLSGPEGSFTPTSADDLPVAQDAQFRQVG